MNNFVYDQCHDTHKVESVQNLRKEWCRNKTLDLVIYFKDVYMNAVNFKFQID